MRGENRIWLFQKCVPPTIHPGLDLLSMPGLGKHLQ